jgi:hypothetical protein
VTRWTAEDVARVHDRLRQSIAAPLAPAPAKRSKYGNSKILYQGIIYDSKHELECYKAFELQRIAGGIRAVIRQVSLTLPHTIRRIRIDFLVIENDGAHRWYDAKGFMTPEWAGKRDQVKTAYGIDINLI